MSDVASSILAWAALQGIDHAFVLAGADVDVLVKAVRADAKIKVVYVNNETAAVNMAEGYGRRTGRPALVLACGGPGLVGLVVGAAQAAGSDCPILYLTGSTGSSQDEVGWLVPDGPLMTAAGCPSLSLTAPVQLPSILRKFGQLLAEGRQVHLQVASSVQGASCELLSEEPALPPASAARPVMPTGLFLLAVGDRALAFTERIAELAQSKAIPLVTDMTARGVLPESHPLAMGHLTFSPEPRAVAALASPSDNPSPKVVALAPSLALRSALRRLGVVPEVIESWQIDNWLTQARQSVEVCSRRTAWVEGLNQSHPRVASAKAASDTLGHGGVVELAQQILGADAIHVVDAGVFHQSAVARLRAARPRTILSTDTLTSMGWSFGAAIGAALGSPDSAVVAYAGDGCFQIQGLTLATAARLRLGILFIVGINGVYASSRARHAPGPDDPALVSPCDIPAVARACGVPADICETAQELRKALAGFNPADGPRLLAVTVGVGDSLVRNRPLGIPGLDKK